MKSLKSLTFASGSKLKEIKSFAFDRCSSLKSILLPASLSIISAQAFTGSSIENVVVDETSPYLIVAGNCLIGIQGMTLIWYFRDIADVIVPREYESVGPYCFSACKSLRSAVFEDRSKASRIEDMGFSRCTGLKSICIPASVEFLGACCFSDCESLFQVSFESGSRLTQIESWAFAGCSSLPSICIPAQVECIPTHCFDKCGSLTEFSFETGSKLTRIDVGAFEHCRSLAVVTIPPHAEVLDSGLFSQCGSLRQLIFDPPSRLKEFSLLLKDLESLCIPDSIETFSAILLRHARKSPLLQFGPKSRLTRIEIARESRSSISSSRRTWGRGAFVRLPEGTLRRFRCKFE
jgi:hypothetical protein